MNQKERKKLMDEVFDRQDINWHAKSILIRCVYRAKGRSAVLKNPYLLFDKMIGKRLPI